MEVRNFLGNKDTRTIGMLGDAKVMAGGKDELVVEGNDIDDVSQSAALIRQSCLVKRKDIRKFLDGIFVSWKGAIPLD